MKKYCVLSPEHDDKTSQSIPKSPLKVDATIKSQMNSKGSLQQFDMQRNLKQQEGKTSSIENRHQSSTIVKSALEEEFLTIANDIRREVVKTRFIRGTPSLETQMHSVDHRQSIHSLK